MARRTRRREERGPQRPPPIVGVEAAQARLIAALERRPDRFSQLLARASKSEHAGPILVSSSGLSTAEHDELLRLGPVAHAELTRELEVATENLRELLSKGDPFFSLAVVQERNLLVPWGEYHEPTHDGLETRIELVAGLLATQSTVAPIERPSPADVQAMLDEIDHILLVNLLVSLTKAPAGGLHRASLRFSNATRWTSLRGSSFAGHAEELAIELYGGQDEWMARSLGYTTPDLIRVGQAVSALHADRRNELGDAAARAANALVEEAQDGVDERETMARAFMEIISVTEAGLRDAVSVTAEQICAQDASLAPACVEAILRDLSVAVGSGDSTKYRGLFDVNPLRERPFLEHRGAHMLALPAALSRDVDTLMEARVQAARPGFARQRAATLDRLVAGYLTRLLPGSSSHLNLHYEGAELDGLVLFERTVWWSRARRAGSAPRRSAGTWRGSAPTWSARSKRPGGRAPALASTCCGRASRCSPLSAVWRRSACPTARSVR